MREAISVPDSVEVRAGARLHLGFLDLAGDLGRRFGSLGLAIDGFETRVAMRRAPEDSVAGFEPERTRALLHRIRQTQETCASFAAEVSAAIPAHAGLGSGTQLALAAARAVRELQGLPADTRADARALTRGARSGLGVALFDHGGFALDGGRGPATEVPPALCLLPFPADWRVVLLRDDATPGAHGEAERAAFAALPPFPAEIAAELCRRALMQVAPGVAEADFRAFAEGISAIQRRVGDHFAPAQGGARFASARVGRAAAALERAGAMGLGQSSWGPTGFVFAPDPEQGVHWARLAREASEGVVVQVHAARARGAEVRLNP